MKNLVVIGSGMAAVKLIESIVESPLKDWVFITVIGEEDILPYNRILLSDVINGKKKVPEVILKQSDWYYKNNIEVILGNPVVSLDCKDKSLFLQNGQCLSYDYAVFATGSKVMIPPIEGIENARVISYRGLADVQSMHRATEEACRIGVLGGGLLGLEAAWELKARGAQVCIIHLMNTLMERQIDEAASDLLRSHFERHDIPCYLSYATKCIRDRKGELTLEFSNPSDSIDLDYLVLATGIRARKEVAEKSGIQTNRGILVNDRMETSDSSVFAIGECAEFNEECVGLVAPVYEMAGVLVSRLSEVLLGARSSKHYYQKNYLTKLKVSGIELCSAGEFLDSEDTESISLIDKSLGIYKKVVLKEDRVIGFINFGEMDTSDWLFELMNSSKDVGQSRRSLIFGPDSGQSSGQTLLASLPDDYEVCGCNGVSKGQIVATVRDQSITKLSEVQKCTKAGTGCGSCQGKVRGLLEYALGELGEQVVEEKQTVCACTDLSHEEVREALKSLQVSHVLQAFQMLNWKNEDGCPKCRPALNYYLHCLDPLNYQDHEASRNVNERVHANIQRDGTFSVVPRMYGGVTSSKELRLIADVADEFSIPTVKVTGGQRIDLLGVKKEDLPKVWSRLNEGGMVSGHAYGKAVRTVKTCVGSEWCRFGTQDSTGLGIAIEKMCWGSWTPHKVKMAVSGCPRNCAESTIKDIGIIAVESGWEIYVGGNGGTKVRVSELLTKVESDDEVFEIVGAFLQFYREDARYLERTSHWIERVGLDYIKTNVLESIDLRRSLFARFQKAQHSSQKDPWSEVGKSLSIAH